MKKCFTPLLFATFTVATSTLPAQWVINELHADPAPNDGAETPGDANGDGVRGSTDDEFIELVNNTGSSVDIEDWTITDASGLRHTFVGSTVVADGQVVLVFGGGTPTGSFGGAITQVASGGNLSLNNNGDTVTLLDNAGTSVVSVVYGSEGGGDESLTRDPDLTGAFVQHSDAAGANGAIFSPGTQVSGAPFGGDALVVSVVPESFSEGAGVMAATGTVTRTGDISMELTVSLSASDESELAVQLTVIIPAGQGMATFDIMALDDADQDGDQSVTITASADGLFSGTTTVTVEDDEDPIPTISLEAAPVSISENGGTSFITLTVSAPSPDGYSFDVAINDASELAGPSMVSIAANETSVDFTVTGVDDAESDGSRSVQVVISDPNALIITDAIEITVTDDEVFVAPSIVINEVRIVAPATVPQNGEYFELYSAESGASLDRITLVVLGDSSNGSGVVEAVVDLSGLSMNGNYFVGAQTGQDVATAPDLETTLDFENSDNVTFLLVVDFTASRLDDLDTDDDGVLDLTPWSQILDGFALVIDDAIPPTFSEWEYATSLGFPVIGPNEEFTPSHVYRDSSSETGFAIGLHDPTDLNALDTPGTVNAGGPPLVLDPKISEINIVDASTGEAELVVIGLGSSVFKVEFSNDLTENSAWQILSRAVTEVDNADGSVTMSFTDPAIITQLQRFYRIKEAN